MSEQTMTVGELVDQRGPCQLMLAVMALAEKHGRIPCGEWDYRFESDPKFRLLLNGGTKPEWKPTGAFMPVKRFECVIEHDGWAVANFNTAEGVVLGGFTEADLLAAIDREEKL